MGAGLVILDACDLLIAFSGKHWGGCLQSLGISVQEAGRLPEGVEVDGFRCMACPSGEIFFKEFAKQFPLAAPEEGLGLEREFKPPFVQPRIGCFVQIGVVACGFQLLLE